TMARRGSGGIATSGLTPDAQVVTRADQQTGVGGMAVAEPAELHVHDGDLGIPRPLVVHEQLLDDGGEELDPRLLLPCAEEPGCADFVDDGRGALFPRGVDHEAIQRSDRVVFTPTVVAQLAGLVRARYDRAVGDVQ